MKYLIETAAKPVPPVIYDRTAYVGARSLIKACGRRALAEADRKVVLHEGRNEHEQAHYWRRVQQALDIIFAEAPEGTIH
ncbi:MAG: hypothetical protein AAGF15_01245 [Pseudomonadota bacterium]